MYKLQTYVSSRQTRKEREEGRKGGHRFHTIRRIKSIRVQHAGGRNRNAKASIEFHGGRCAVPTQVPPFEKYDSHGEKKTVNGVDASAKPFSRKKDKHFRIPSAFRLACHTDTPATTHRVFE